MVPFLGLNEVTMSMDLSKLVIDPLQVDGGFLYYLLMTDKARRFMQDHASGSTVLHLQTKSVPNLELLIPKKVEEQTQIAAILSTIDRAIEQTEAIIAKQQRIKTGLMQDLLTKGIDEDGNVRSDATHKFKDSPLGQIPTAWEAKTIGGILNEYGGKLQTGPFGSQLHASEYVAEGIPFVMPQDIQNSGISEVNIARITEERANDLARHRMLPGDIVFARRGDLSRCAVVTTVRTILNRQRWNAGFSIITEANTNGGMRVSASASKNVRSIGSKGISKRMGLWLRLLFNETSSKESISPRWITEVYRYYTTQLQVNVQAVGSTMVNLNKGILASLYIPFPTHREQVQIEERLNDMEKDQIKLWQQLDKLKCSKIGLMQDLLTGNVRVTALLND